MQDCAPPGADAVPPSPLRSLGDLPPITQEDYALLASLFDSNDPDAPQPAPQPEGYAVPRPPQWEYRLGFWKPLREALRAWSRDNGFMTVVAGSDSGKWKAQGQTLKGIRRGTIVCARSGPYRGHGPRTNEPPGEDIKTRKTECPFSVHYTIDPTTNPGIYVLREDHKDFCLSHNDSSR